MLLPLLINLEAAPPPPSGSSRPQILDLNLPKPKLS